MLLLVLVLLVLVLVRMQVPASLRWQPFLPRLLTLPVTVLLPPSWSAAPIRAQKHSLILILQLQVLQVVVGLEPRTVISSLWLVLPVPLQPWLLRVLRKISLNMLLSLH
jgi:hypothetical protein